MALGSLLFTTTLTAYPVLIRIETPSVRKAWLNGFGGESIFITTIFSDSNWSIKLKILNLDSF